MNTSPLVLVLMPLLLVALIHRSRHYAKGSKENRLFRAATLVMLVPALYVGHRSGTWETIETNLRDKFGGRSVPNTSLGYAISAPQAAAAASLASQAKPAIVDFYQGEDRLPRGSDVVMLPPGAKLLENGALEVTVDGNPSVAVYWRLATGAGGSIGWHCITRSIANISDYLPDCRYDPSFKKDEPIIAEYLVQDHLYFNLGRTGKKGLPRGEEARFQEVLAAIAPRTESPVVDIEVSGFADPSGSAATNARLAEARARFARESFVAVGVDRALIRMRVVGVDPSAPRRCLDLKARQERIDCLSQSRRVDFTIKARKVL